MKPSILQLEDYFLTRLEIRFDGPAEPEIESASVNSTFHYDVMSHKEDAKRRMLAFHVEFRELDGKERNAGYHIVCSIVGMFRFTDATPEDKEDYVICVNGISILYGALRGILSTATGNFPRGRFLAPSVMPNEIVADIERKRQETPKDAESAPEGSQP